jgi:hypothetical protein
LSRFNSFRFPNKKLTFEDPDDSDGTEEEDENIKTIIDKSIGVIGALPRKYLPFPDNKFGIWVDEQNFYIGGKDSKVEIDGNDLNINNGRYKGTHGLWKLLTNPNRKNLDKDTYESRWTNKNNFTEKDLNLYKEILMKTHSMYQNNDPLSKSQSLVFVENGTI